MEDTSHQLGSDADQLGGPADESGDTMNESLPEPERSSAAAAHDELHSGSSRQLAEAALAELSAMTSSWPVDSKLWGFMLVAA